MTSSIHHFVPRLEGGAVGAHVLQLRRLTEEITGRRSEIFAGSAAPAFVSRCRPHQEYGTRVRPRRDDVLVYQMAIGSPVAVSLYGRRQTLVVNHHNLTPVRFLSGWDIDATEGIIAGEAQLRELGRAAALGVADSAYNEAELYAAGYETTAVAPVLVDLDAMTGQRDLSVERTLDDAKQAGGRDWLFVGRLSPNKCQHQVIKAFAAYRKVYDPAARLWLVGGGSVHRYTTALQRFVHALGLGETVTLTGSVSEGALASYYRHADAFVCLSEHEGFCIPLLEAMWHRVPIVALATSAVPETLDGAGLSLPMGVEHQPAPAVVAAAVHRVMSDEALRKQLLAAQSARVKQLSLEHSRSKHRALLSQFVDR
jgi:L-malate glycosyltransferase